ncbi:hypothetical protein TGPRC2_426390 [Toxoplasma gondii TgCatPRC2]|uniref:Uncharacterized protein n=1 Tax=Toxoplasma gondii TgCatPRC2 TaxID=1130821 RepID=A0A151H509_TOXGO|nr:hypothetical protein TGPRC2_426390 [Toxoplasma gondii TgCatPRC2]
MRRPSGRMKVIVAKSRRRASRRDEETLGVEAVKSCASVGSRSACSKRKEESSRDAGEAEERGTPTRTARKGELSESLRRINCERRWRRKAASFQSIRIAGERAVAICVQGGEEEGDGGERAAEKRLFRRQREVALRKEARGTEGEDGERRNEVDSSEVQRERVCRGVGREENRAGQVEVDARRGKETARAREKGRGTREETEDENHEERGN